MMKCLLYSNGEMVGWAEMTGFDPGMGCAQGVFQPNAAYQKIRPVIREFSLLGSLADHTQEEWLCVQDKLKALNLVALDEVEQVLQLEGGIALYEFSEELEDDPYELNLLGLSQAISDKYFREVSERYFDHGNKSC